MPRKKKPIYRARNIAIVAALLIGLLIGREVYLSVTAESGQSVNYAAKVAALLEAGQPKDIPPDSPNGVELLDRAITIEAEVMADFRARIQLPGGHFPVEYSLLRGPMSTKPYGPAIFEQIKQNSIAAIETLRKTEFYTLLDRTAATRRAVRPTPTTGQLVNFMLPNLGRYRHLARLNGARMYLAHHAGDDDEFARAFEHTLAVGRVAGHGSFLIEYLVAIAIDALATIELRENLVERVPDEATLVKMLEAMDRQALPSMSTAVEGERLSVMDTIQFTHTDDGRGSGRLITSKFAQMTAMWGGGGGAGGGGFMQEAGAWRIMNLGGSAFPSKAANVRRADQFFDLVQSGLAKPFYARGDVASKIDGTVDTLPKRYVVLRTILPAWGRSLQSWDQFSATWEGTRVMLAVEIYKRRHGQYPARLEELSPSVMSTVPADPFSGRMFGYRVIDPATDPHKRGYLLYTVGVDGIDNGGTPAAKDFEAFRPRVGKGFDFILNVPKTPPEPDDPVPAPAEDQPPPPPSDPPPSGTAPSP